MKLTTRSFFTCALLGLMPLTANAQMQTVEDAAQAIDQFAGEVEAAEAVPFVDGSEGSAQRQLDELRVALQSQEAAMNTTAAAIAGAQNMILAALPAFPRAQVLPEVPVEPLPNQDPDQVTQDPPLAAEIPILADWTTTGQPALSALVAPLAYNERARRVLSRPGARLQDEAGNFTPLPSFSVFYVYAEGMSGSVPILAVGGGTRGAEGWVQASQTEDWRTMLVMSYAPNTGRDRTVFFASENDVFDVLDLEEGSGAAIRSIHNQIEEGSYDPEKIVAIEPALTVNSVERPYLMPVLDFVQTSTETHGDVTILQLAALNRDSTDISTAGAQSVGEDRITIEADARDFKVGVAFVIDTTRSMGPYIDRAQDFVRDISLGLTNRGLQDQFDFALVGFRDNVGAGQDVEYLRRVYRDFGVVSSRGSLFADVEDMQPAAASTANWREDAFAGIDLAIGGLNWGEVDSRLVFLITDASPRTVGDALASDSRMGPETINALAAQRNISLFVLHMQTEQAASVSQSTEGYDDTARGQQLYARLSQTGDAAISKYFSVQGQTEQAFADSLNLVAGLVIDQLSELSLTGRLTQPQALLDDPFLDAVTAGGSVVIEDEGDAPLIAAAVAGELFRYQTEYLGARSGVEAPDFYRGWAVDKDIANPGRRSLEVSVFVTRDQLSDLANRLGDIVTGCAKKTLVWRISFPLCRQRPDRRRLIRRSAVSFRAIWMICLMDQSSST